MIPDFKTYLKESVWMDIHKRSNNEIDRKEEYVDFDELEPKELCDYIKNNYILSDILGVTGYDDDNAELHVHILQYEKNQSKFKQVTFDTLQYDYENDVIKIHKDTYPQVLEKLQKKFVVTNYDQFEVKIVPDDLGEPSNKFFMEVLDYIVEILPEIPGVTPLIKNKKQVLESVWMDIHKHSTGDMERMEDAVDTNGLFPGEMVQYLKNRYEYTIQNPKYSEQITHAGGSDFYDIDVPLYPSCSLRISYEMKRDVIKKMKLQLYFSKDVSKEQEQRNANVLYQLENKYIVECLHSYDYIRPRKGKVTNNFAVELIDFILSVTENKPYILKRI